MKAYIYTLLIISLLSACSEEQSPTVSTGSLESDLAEVSVPLSAANIDSLIDVIGDSETVLLGEASHGTSEYYEWRAEISKRLIQEKGFTIIGVEGDWPDLYRFNNYIRGNTPSGTNADAVLSTLDRWPTWMWANAEVATLGDWLADFNEGRTDAVSFYGLDLYSLWDSIEEVIEFLDQRDPMGAQLARNALKCFGAFEGGDEFAYAQAKQSGDIDCAGQLSALLTYMDETFAVTTMDDEAFNAVQNARIAVNAERYYTTALQSSAESWNIRDRHMMETVNAIREHHAGAKMIIWAHNTHVGDARATTMGDEGMVNLGQLVREHLGEDRVSILGFGSHVGTVVASLVWGSPWQEMQVPPAQKGSWEDVLKDVEPGDKIVYLEPLEDNSRLTKKFGHRAIGVVYNPSAEARNYVPSILPERYDVFLFIEETSALNPLHHASSGRTGLNAGD